MDSIHFGDHCFRTGVGKILPVFINEVLLNTATLFVYVLSLVSFVPQWQSWATITGMVWSSKPELGTVWLLTEKDCHLCFRKWMALEGSQEFSVWCILNSLFTRTGAIWSIKDIHGLLGEYISMFILGSIILAEAQGLALILANGLYPGTQLQFEL